MSPTRIEIRKECPAYGWMSNFSNHPIVVNGVVYPTAEHLYQVLKLKKTNTDEHKKVKDSILKAKTPAEAKRLGKAIKQEMMRPYWDTERVAYMRAVLWAKLKSNPELIKLLVDTDKLDIVEVTFWHDKFWGICTCPTCKNTGTNNLGALWAEIRTKLSSMFTPVSVIDV